MRKPTRQQLKTEGLLFAGIIALVLVASLAFDQPATLWINIVFVISYLATRAWKYTRPDKSRDAAR
jgi:hypothetical protein